MPASLFILAAGPESSDLAPKESTEKGRRKERNSTGPSLGFLTSSGNNFLIIFQLVFLSQVLGWERWLASYCQSYSMAFKNSVFIRVRTCNIQSQTWNAIEGQGGKRSFLFPFCLEVFLLITCLEPSKPSVLIHWRWPVYRPVLCNEYFLPWISVHGIYHCIVCLLTFLFSDDRLFDFWALRILVVGKRPREGRK